MEHKDAKRFLDAEYPVAIRSQMIPMLQVGASLSATILNEHPELYHSSLAQNIRGRIFSFAVMLQLSPEIGVFQTSYYQTRIKRVNNFGYVIPEVISQGAILHIAKTTAPYTLPRSSRYKREYAKHNTFSETQQMFELNYFNNNIKVSEHKKYALLTYGSKDNKNIDFARLVVPNSRFSGIVHDGVIDLNVEWKLYRGNDSHEEMKEKQLVELKRGIAESLNIQL